MRRRTFLIPLLVLCFVPLTILHAQQPDMHSLQQQLAWTTDRLQMTGFLITSILLLLMGAGCLALWWNARSHKAFGTVGLFLLAISGVFFADYLESRPWNDFLTVLTSILFIEVTADCLRIEKRRWIVPVRLLGAATLVVSWIPALSWTFHLPIELSKVLGPVLLIVRLRHPLPQHRFILRAIIPAIAIVAFFRLRLNSHYPGLSWLPFYFTVGGWRWYYGPLATVLFGAVTIAVFVRELIEDQREKERLTTELEAGRTMQQVLLDPDAAYSETTVSLSSTDTLTLVSDGIPEATSPTGELFGFERTAAISTQSAQAIADVAQAFGQEDDITVLTLQRMVTA